MDDHDKPTPGQQAKAALTAAMALPRPLPRPTPEFQAYVNSLDAMDLHIAGYLLHDLKVPSSLVPALVQLIDTRCFEARLQLEVADDLKRVEEESDD
jgi:hypothetical protein